MHSRFISEGGLGRALEGGCGGGGGGEQNKHTAGDSGPNIVYLEKSETIIA